MSRARKARKALLNVLTKLLDDPVKIGDIVQWESGGVLQLEEPSRVNWISECGQWLTVEGSRTGLPVTEIVVVKRPRSS